MVHFVFMQHRGLAHSPFATSLFILVARHQLTTSPEQRNCHAKRSETGCTCQAQASPLAQPCAAMRTAGQPRTAERIRSTAASATHRSSSPAAAGSQVVSRQRAAQPQLPLSCGSEFSRSSCIGRRLPQRSVSRPAFKAMAAGQDQQADYSELEAFAHELADTAAAVTTPYFRQGTPTGPLPSSARQCISQNHCGHFDFSPANQMRIRRQGFCAIQPALLMLLTP